MLGQHRDGPFQKCSQSCKRSCDCSPARSTHLGISQKSAMMLVELSGGAFANCGQAMDLIPRMKEEGKEGREEGRETWEREGGREGRNDPDPKYS